MAQVTASELRLIRKYILIPHWDKCCNIPSPTPGRGVIAFMTDQNTQKLIALGSPNYNSGRAYAITMQGLDSLEARQAETLLQTHYVDHACLDDQIRDGWSYYSRWWDGLVEHLQTLPFYSDLYVKHKIASRVKKEQDQKAVKAAVKFTKQDQLDIAESVVAFLLGSAEHQYLINLILELAKKKYYRQEIVPVPPDPTANKIVESLSVFNIDQEKLKEALAGHENESARRFVALIDKKYTIAGLLDKDEKVRTFAEVKRQQLKKVKPNG